MRKKANENIVALPPLKIVVLGLSITSSWGNGHATTYRSLIKELSARGHDVLFLERDTPWYSANRDLPRPPYGRTELYNSIGDLKKRFEEAVGRADVVIVGSYVPEGVKAGRWVVETACGITAFYDIDTPVTIAKLGRGDYEYIDPGLVGRYKLYLSFTGGPLLKEIEKKWGARLARPLYCSVDTELYLSKKAGKKKWDMGYIGTYSPDRQSALDELMLRPARKLSNGNFVVAGPLYPGGIEWPGNVQRIEHLPPSGHTNFYNSMRFTLNITRADMIRAGYSPSVRLFEAASCATPVISDNWEGLSEFFTPGEEILISSSSKETARYLTGLTEKECRAIGERARSRVLASHTSSHRVDELESYMLEVLKKEKV